MKLINYFDRAYVLNLPYRTDRRKAMEKELSRVGVSSHSGQVEIFPAIRPETPEPFKKIGSKGCFLSVIEILKQAQAESLSRVLIIQDDLKFSEYYESYEDKIVDQLNQIDWDIVQLGYYPYGHFPEEWSVAQSPQSPLFGTLQDYDGDLIGAHFFGVNGKSIARLISFLEDLLNNPDVDPLGGKLNHMMPIDGAMTVFRKKHPDTVRLISLPSFGGQRSSKSDVSPKWFDSVPVLKSLPALLRSTGLTKLKKRAK